MEKLLERSYHITWNNEDEKQQIVNYLESIGFECCNKGKKGYNYILTYPHLKYGFHNHDGCYTNLDLQEIINLEPIYEIY